MNFRRISIASLALLPSLASAQAAASSEAGGVVQVVLGLGVVLALMLGSLWLLKRIAAPRGVTAGFMRVVTAIGVGPRERVVVVEVGDTWLVLGVAPGRVTTLHQMPRQEIPAASAGPGGDFAARLRKLMEPGVGSR